MNQFDAQTMKSIFHVSPKNTSWNFGKNATSFEFVYNELIAPATQDEGDGVSFVVLHQPAKS